LQVLLLQSPKQPQLVDDWRPIAEVHHGEVAPFVDMLTQQLFGIFDWLYSDISCDQLEVVGDDVD